MVTDKKSTLPLQEDAGIIYEIKIKGHLEEHWSDWLGGLKITKDGFDYSLLTGVVADQAALHGILNQIRDLGLTLISISPQVMAGERSKKYHYAGFAIRLKAFAFDYLIILSYILLLTMVTTVVIKVSGLLGSSVQWPKNPVLADLMAFVTLILPVILYFTLQESSPKQSTWGKLKAGIRVIDANGSTLSRRQAFVRSFVKVIPWQISHTCLFHIPGWPLAVTMIPLTVTIGFVSTYMLATLYIAAIFTSKKHRTPYDWASGSCVIVDE